MPRIPSPFRRNSDNWVVNTIHSSESSNTSSNPRKNDCEKQEAQVPTRSKRVHTNTSFLVLLQLLLWKNFKLQVRNKFSTVAELLLPLIFTILIVAIRFFGAETKRFDNATLFEPFQPSVIPGTIATCCNQIFYTPNLPIVRRLMEEVQINHFNKSDLRYSFIGFDTEHDLIQAYANSSSGMYAETEDGELSSTVLAGVVFTNILDTNASTFPPNIEYRLRFPAALRSQSGLLGERFGFGMKEAWFTEILYPIIQPFGPRAKDQPTGGEPGYWSEGFLYLQYAIEKELVNYLTSSSTIKSPLTTNVSIFLRRFPYAPYVDDEFLVVLQPFLPLTLILSFIYTATSISKTLVTEKERRIHESMKMMGLTNVLHWTAWFITFLTMFAVSSLVITILLKLHLTESSKSAGLAVFPKSDPSLIFFCLLVHGFQLVSFCFFVSSLFKTANAAAITSAIVWFMLFLPFPFLQPRYSILSSRVKIMWSMLTNMGICFCCQVFCMFEGSQKGAQWGTIFQGVTPDDSFCIANCVLVMLFNGAVYFLTAMYISVVWPGEYGIGQRWYFFLTKKFWLGGLSIADTSYNYAAFSCEKSDFYERTPKSLAAGIQVQDLSKKYSEITAIDHLNLTMYKNETFCLLGKNGAGKSSLVGVLTGLYPPSCGTAFVNDLDIRTDINSVRRSLGVCPQNNILFDELTVQEHLGFFSTLKGLQKNAINKEVNRMIAALGLVHKSAAQVKTLSGGMKRRLCIGIAFCAGSEVVILDEPSSGLDVEARRAIWDLIESEKVGRTVLLTTHFMEEAELLGDRIAIMVNGKVPCCGSPLFLNKKYNGGYNLTIVMSQEKPKNRIEITNFVQSFLSEATLIRDAGKELTFALPESKTNEFPDLFDAMEREQEVLGIETYGARLTSMEDIFIRVNAATDEENVKTKPQKEEPTRGITFLNGSKINSELCELPSHSDIETTRNKSLTLMLQQFCGITVKKAQYLWRRRGLVVGQIILPMGFLSLVLVVLKTIPGIFDPPPHSFQLEHYELFGRTVTPLQCTNSTSLFCSSYADYFAETLHKLVENFPMNDSYMDILVEKQESNIAAFNSKYIVGFNGALQNGSTVFIGFFNNQPLHTPPLALNAITNGILKMVTNHTVQLTNHPFPYTNLDTQDTGTYWTVGFHVGYNTAFALTFVVAVFATFLVKEETIGATSLQRISGLNPAVYWISNFIVDFFNYVLPCIGLLLIFAVFSESTGFLSWSLQGYLLILFLSFGWALIPVVYIMSQWFKVPAVGFAGCGVACAFSGFITILIITILELPQINQVNLATTLHRIFLIFPTYALGRGITQMSINRKLQEKCAGFNLEFLCDAAPDSYCCVKLRANYLDWEETGIGKNVVYMMVVGVMAMLTLAVIESKFFRQIRSRVVNLNSKSGCRLDYEDDEAVRLERERLRGEISEAVVIKDLTKTYDSVLAVAKLTVGVKEGQCFGLLGTNGAGKSSTFKMLVGEIPPDSGDAFICSYSVTDQKRKTHRLIGYCPQFDALLGELTGRETLTMFARLRGVPETAIPKIVNNISKELSFEQYIDRIVECYSGGNKRKLSTAVALIGAPKVVFLDEPTAGMDPLARRQMWSAISSRMRNKLTSVILTSHSLEECEVLCTRIGIMKHGQLHCLGSPQQLKHKFGDGFSIIVQIKGAQSASDSDRKELLQRKMSSLSQISTTSTVSSLDAMFSTQMIDNYLQSHFPSNTTECILTSSHANYLNYHVKGRNGNCIKWSTLFKVMEEIKEQTAITAYSISQISLEQVFFSV